VIKLHLFHSEVIAKREFNVRRVTCIAIGFSLRTPPLVEMNHGGMTMLMPNPMAMQVTRRTLNSRLAMTSEWNKWSLITGVDSQFNKHGGSISTNGGVRKLKLSIIWSL
jgi:hypothetical protein